MTPFSVLLELSQRERLTSDDFARALGAKEVKDAKPGQGVQKLSDGGGMFLQVAASGSKTGSKSWRYAFRLSGKQQLLTIGGYPSVSLADARSAHRAARWLVARGIHPLKFATEKIRATESEKRARAENSFAAVADRWMEATDSTLSPRTVKHRRAMLEKHIHPAIGDRPIGEIVRLELREVLVKIDTEAPVTAKHCRSYIGQIFEWAEDAEIVTANPTPRAKMLVNASSRAAVPRKALPLSKLGEFLVTLADAEKTDPLTKAALRLTLLTWGRTSEILGARWAELDLGAGVWVIPAARMKAREAHTVYLARQAVALLDGLERRAEHVFPNRRQPGEPMSRTALTEWRKRHGFAEIMEIHGLRAVASTWANEAGKYRPDVVEVALAHKEGDRVRRAYNRAQFAEELRKMWQDWADQCDRLEAMARAGNIVPLRSNTTAGR